MNKTFKIVFNKVRGTLMVTNELTSSAQTSCGNTIRASVAIAVLASVFSITASAATSAVYNFVEDGTPLTEAEQGGSGTTSLSVGNSSSIISSIAPKPSAYYSVRAFSGRVTINGSSITLQKASNSAISSESSSQISIGSSNTKLLDIQAGGWSTSTGAHSVQAQRQSNVVLDAENISLKNISSVFNKQSTAIDSAATSSIAIGSKNTSSLTISEIYNSSTTYTNLGVNYKALYANKSSTINLSATNIDISAIFNNHSSFKENSYGFADQGLYAIDANKQSTITVGDKSTKELSIISRTESKNGNNFTLSATNGGHINVTAENISIAAKGHNDEYNAAILLQNSTQDEDSPETASSINITGTNIDISSDGNGFNVYSNGKLNINGNLNASALNNIIDTRGNAVININTDGLHSTVLNGDIAFETPYTPDNSQNSGDIINSNVSINLTGKTSSWTGRSYQQRGKDAAKTVAIDVDDAVYGKVTGFKATLADGGKWNVTGDSFINSLTLKNGGIVNASDAVKTLNIGDLTIEGTGNQLTLANAGAVNGTINFADGAGLTTALNTAYTINDADKLANGAVNNAAGRLTLGSVGTGASMTISDAFTYTQAGLDAITSAYNGLTINLDNASLYVDPASEDKEFNINKGTIGLIAKGDEAITGGAESLKVGGDAVLNVKSSATTNVATATDITVNGTMNVTDASLSADTLNVAENAQVNIGTPTSAGELHVAELTSAAGSKIFLDPAWQDGATIADASFMSAATLTENTVAGNIAVGQNSVVALNASKDAAISAFNKTGLTWGADNVTAALYIGAPITVSGSINVDGTMTTETGATYGTSGIVSIRNHGLLMVDQTGVGSSAAIDGSLTLASGSYVGVANADVGSVTLATEVADDGATVVTDNPFFEGAINGNAVDVSVSPTGGLGALASTGIQAMTRRADTVLAQTIADRTSVDQELAAGTNLWVDVTGERYEADKLDNGGEFQSDMGYGAFGADFAVTQDITAGAAFQYGKGSLRSDVSSIKNSIDSYGVTAYGAMKFGNAKVVAEASYIKNENDITSSQTALNQSVDSEIYSVGVRGQHRFTAGNFQFVPSVGVRVSRLNTDAMQVGAVNIKKQEQTLVQVPIALRVNGFEQNVSGWSVAPSFKVAYVPTFGDKEISVFGADQTVIDTSPVQGDFGIRAQNGNLMVNANMMLGGGKDGTSSVGGKVGLKYVF